MNDFEDSKDIRGWVFVDGTDCGGAPQHTGGGYNGDGIRMGGDCSTTNYDTAYHSQEYVVTEEDVNLNFWDRTDYKNSCDHYHKIFFRKNGDDGWHEMNHWECREIQLD